MNPGTIFAVVLIAAGAFWAYRFIGTPHGEGMFVAKASGALFDLGLDVERLPDEAQKKFFREGHAAYEATKNRPRKTRYNAKFIAMAFFAWYGVGYRRMDPKAFLREGVLAESIGKMRAWARKEPELNEAAEIAVKKVFDYLYQSFETMQAPKETILEAQLTLLGIMKDTEPK